MTLRLSLQREEDTRALGERIGRCAQAGDVICLRGELGAGKTTLTQGIARGLGVGTWVNSPTFVLVTEHRGRLPLYHVDAYRLPEHDPEAARDIGLEERLFGDGVCVVEWAERVQEALPDGRLDVLLEHAAEGRMATLVAHDERYRQWLLGLRVETPPVPPLAKGGRGGEP